MALSPNEQPTRLRGEVTESAINTFTAIEISVPRSIESRQLFDADLIKLACDRPVRTTAGGCGARVQLQLSDDTPTTLMTHDDPKLVANLSVFSNFVLAESAAGVFTVQANIFTTEQNRDGIVNSERWRNFLHDDKVWLCTESFGVTAVIVAQAEILGKLDKASQQDFEALILSKL